MKFIVIFGLFSMAFCPNTGFALTPEERTDYIGKIRLVRKEIGKDKPSIDVSSFPKTSNDMELRSLLVDLYRDLASYYAYRSSDLGEVEAKEIAKLYADLASENEN